MMKRTACVASVLAVLLIAAGAMIRRRVSRRSWASSIRGPTPLWPSSRRHKRDTPDWKDVKDLTEDFVKLGAAWPRTNRPKATARPT